MLRRKAFASICGLACLVAVGCGGSDDSAFSQRQGTQARAADTTGATADEIVVGIHGPKTAAAAALVADVFTGFNLYVDQLNERGGVNGRTLRVVEVDDQFTVAGGTAAAKELVQDGVLVALNLAGADSAVGAQPVFEQQGIPYLTVALPLNKLDGAATTFVTTTPLEQQAAALPSFVAAELDGASKRIGIIRESTDIYGAMADEVVAGASAAGLEIVATETVDADAPSFSSALLKLREQEVDLVLVIGGLSAPGVLRDAKSIGYDPEWSGVGPWATDFFAALAKGAMEGIRAVRPTQGVDAASFPEFERAWNAKTPPTELGFGGWLTGVQLEAILERAGDEPSRSGIVELLEATMDDPIAPDPAAPPLRFSPERHWGSDEVLPSQVQDGLWRRTGDWARRFGER